ncbi:hypothetical protein ACFYNL_10680 [Streptomyces sp. NPDC007808]|uniref:hypothetical protein n=1 Tax=Streptomyces sp. NPDC007808 TaxID=3364779 RepID=UPI0036852A62
MNRAPHRRGVRLLPWTGEGGKPCYLDTDGTGRLSRLADTAERVQLAMADDLLGHVDDVLADRRVTPDQLRFLLARMREALADVRRVAESRGARLAGAAWDEDDPGSGPP